MLDEYNASKLSKSEFIVKLHDYAINLNVSNNLLNVRRLGELGKAMYGELMEGE